MAHEETSLPEKRVILITGAARGLGRAIAEAAGRTGFSVAVNYRTQRAEAEEIVSRIHAQSGRAIAIGADVSDVEQAGNLVGATLEAFGRLDCVVNNAGIGEVITLEDLDQDRFMRTVSVNLGGAFAVSQAAWPHMTTDGGRIVFVSSGAARSGGKLSAAYAASKAGMEGLMHYYASELLRYRITANAIAPTLFQTAMLSTMDLPPADSLPLERRGHPEEVWPALRMILDTEYLNGQTIHLDAGRYPT
ncbi:SDR family NAD(P)-dependent oxidoreductase [Kushneria aurantia]|uniref:SDR family NAD(P)-dependent oxidoreductase n=1 Tax=Kushneria aurantia TaxID=504092 RepID=A0ABV6G610_9GAMM|nr:SDR family NAD(P)-dependent oxidoreductase [Kushneria aurantia]